MGADMSNLNNLLDLAEKMLEGSLPENVTVVCEYCTSTFVTAKGGIGNCINCGASMKKGPKLVKETT